MGTFVKAITIGALLAVAAVAAVVVLGITGRLPLPPSDEPPAHLVVIGVGNDTDGTEVASIAFLMNREDEIVTMLDTEATVTIPGTSARSAREAYPFGGGAAVARGLGSQTGGKEIPWVVLPASTWARLVDDAGGIEVDVPQDVSAYWNGKLVVLEAGRQRLSGDEAVAVVSSASFIEDPQVRADLVHDVTAALSAVISADRATLAKLVAQGKAQTSLTQRALEGFTTPQ